MGTPAGLHFVELEAQRDLGPGDRAPGETGRQAGAAPVVFVHGSLDRSTSFMRAARRLEDLAVVIYDRRGYNHSRTLLPIATDLDTHVDDLLALIGGREVVVIGHSLGGLVALSAAQREPDRIRAVGVYEAPLPWYDWWPNRSRAFLTEDPADFAQGFFDRVAGAGSWAKLTEKGKQARR